MKKGELVLKESFWFVKYPEYCDYIDGLSVVKEIPIELESFKGFEYYEGMVIKFIINDGKALLFNECEKKEPIFELLEMISKFENNPFDSNSENNKFYSLIDEIKRLKS